MCWIMGTDKKFRPNLIVEVSLLKEEKIKGGYESLLRAIGHLCRVMRDYMMYP